MPDLPDKVTGIKARPINALIDFCRSLVPLRSRTIRHQWTANGVQSEVVQTISGSLNEDLHFRVEQASGTTLTVHGGRWSRTSHGVETIVAPTVDSGTAAEYSGVKTVTVSGNGYVIATLNDAYAPTALTFSYTTDAPGAVADPTHLVKYLAKVTLANGQIQTIEPMHLGDIRDRIIIPDALSLDYDATSHKEEVKGWTATAATAPFVSTDEFPLRPTGRGAVIYRTVAALLSYIESVWAPSWSSGWGTSLLVWLRLNMKHIDLLDYLDDSHDGLAGRPGYVRLDGDATRNKCAAAMRVGDVSEKASIGPSPRILYDTDGTTPVLNWNAEAGTYEVTWSSRNKWTAATLFVTPTGFITLDASAGGALTLKAKNASTWAFSDKLDMTIGAASTWITAGTFYFYNGVAGTRTAIESMADQLFFFPDNAGTTALWLGGASPYAWSYIYFNGVAGVDIAGFSTKGGVTGGSKKKLEDVGRGEYVIVAS